MIASTRSRVGAFLDNIPWSHATTSRSALGFDFGVRVMDPALGAYLEHVLLPETHDGRPEHMYSLVDRGPSAPARYPLFFDDTRVAVLREPSYALAYLVWHINQEVVSNTSDLILFHASAVEADGVGLVFPAPMESGKTTLAAGLVRAGLRYLTDEAVGIDPQTLLIRPYPKALSVDPGSWEVLADLRPDLGPDLSPYLGAQWHVPATWIRPDAIATSCLPRFVIGPRYVEGAPTALHPITRAEGLSLLAENSFNLTSHGPKGLDAMARLVRGCRCFRLTVGNLDEACELIVRLIRDDKQKEVV
jgi:hypothetical protein